MYAKSSIKLDEFKIILQTSFRYHQDSNLSYLWKNPIRYLSLQNYISCANLSTMYSRKIKIVQIHFFQLDVWEGNTCHWFFLYIYIRSLQKIFRKQIVDFIIKNQISRINDSHMEDSLLDFWTPTSIFCVP